MLLIIGLDGATLDLIAPWMDEGRLPAMASLRAEGACGELQSTLPPVTAPAWASFMTGKNPTHHGVFDFFDPASPDLDVPRLVSAADIQGATLWDYLTAHGVRLGVLNVPLTYPARPVHGFLVPGLLSPVEGGHAQPPNLLEPYRDHLGAYRLTPGRLFRPGDEVAFAGELGDLTERQLAYACALATDRQPDLFMVHFLATDIAQHKLWHTIDSDHPRHSPTPATRHLLAELFSRVDAGIERLHAAYPADTVVVMSDHGFGPQHNVVNINIALEQAGLLRWRPGAGRALWRAASRRRLTHAAASRLRRRQRLLHFADVDWEQTRAFSLGHMGQVTVNLRGRQRWGAVPAADYRSTLAAVESALARLCDPATGARLAVETVRANTKAVPVAGPDLHVIIDGYRSVAYPAFAADGRSVARHPLSDSGSHRTNGILLARGPAIRPGSIVGARLIDLAPTLLHLLGAAIPDDLDGHVLTQLFRSDFLLANPPKRRAAMAPERGLSDGEAATDPRLRDRLRALGYLDS